MEHDVSVAVSALSQLAGRKGLDAAFLRDHLEQEAAEAQRFWYRFPVTPYNAFPLAAYRSKIFAVAGLGTASDVDRYLGLLDDYVAAVGQSGEASAGPRARGLPVPAWGGFGGGWGRWGGLPALGRSWGWHRAASPGWLVAWRGGWLTVWSAWWRGGWRWPGDGCWTTWRPMRARVGTEPALASRRVARSATPG